MISPNGINAVIFDLDGTLRHSRPEGSDVFLDFATQRGAPADRESRHRALHWQHVYWSNSDVLLADLKKYGRENPEFWENFARRFLIALGCTAAQARELAPLVNQHMVDSYEPNDWVPPDVHPTLDALRTAGFTVGIVTNRHAPVDELMQELGFDQKMDFYFTAGEVGYWKPDARIFQHALQHAELRPEESMYVGDNYFADVLGARKAGIKPVLIDPEGVFPDADCPVINTVGEIEKVLAAEPTS